VLDGCGPPAEVTELTCTVFTDPHQQAIPLERDQLVTVVVSATGEDFAGPYLLHASFQ
jgi:hypothetical protein